MNLNIALVFGGSRGIGAACVEALVADGFHVAYTATADASAGWAHTRAYRCDIRDPTQVAQAFASVQADFGGKPHCVIANAGINVPPTPLAEFPLERFRELVDVNILGAFNVLSQAAREIADGGSIIALTTSMVRHAVAEGGPYTATKAAVESLVRSLAKEVAGRGVRVNCVAPGPMTPTCSAQARTRLLCSAPPE